MRDNLGYKLATVSYQSADMRYEVDIEKMMKNVKNNVGPIDVLVNCAGMQHIDAIEDFPIEKWNDIIVCNLVLLKRSCNGNSCNWSYC